MNRHSKFWLTFGSLVTIIILFVFIIFVCYKEVIIFYKQYCLVLLPLLLYSIVQFVNNYYNLTEEYENK